MLWSTRAGTLAFTGDRHVSGLFHQRRIVVAEQHVAKTHRGLHLHLPERARLEVAGAQRIHQRLGRRLHVMPVSYTHLDVYKRQGIGAANRDKIDQRGGFVDLGRIELGPGMNVLVRTLAQQPPHPARYALDF